MKVLPFKIPKTETESFRVQVDESPYFYDTLHKHDEIQITLIVKSEGTLICADYVGEFEEGELFIVGANQPHVLRNNKEFYEETSSGAYAISLFFDRNSFGRDFFGLPESDQLNLFLNRTQRGLKFSSKMRDKIKPILFSIGHQVGINRIIEMLKVIQLLSEAEDYSYLASPHVIKDYDETEGKRMNLIFQFTLKEYYRDISLEEVSQLASMTPNAFCRYFKQRTRKTYVNFLNEIRIANACKLLKNKDLTVAQICYQSGFNNLSHFNRNFKKIQGCSPSEYTKKATTYY